MMMMEDEEIVNYLRGDFRFHVEFVSILKQKILDKQTLNVHLNDEEGSIDFAVNANSDSASLLATDQQQHQQQSTIKKKIVEYSSNNNDSLIFKSLFSKIFLQMFQFKYQSTRYKR